MAPGAPHLAGVTVLDLSSVGPASRASRILADYGAEVIKVGPTSAKGGVQIQPPFYSYGAGRGMKRLRVDLKSPEGKAAFQRVASRSDVIIESFRPGDVQRDSASLVSRLQALEFELANTEIRSPADGVVVGLAVHTIGGVVPAGSPMMEVEPLDEPLKIDAQIAPHLIDKVHPDLNVDILFPAFNQATTPHIPGRVLQVSADVLLEPKQGIPYFKAVVEVTPEGMKQLRHHQIRAGMPAEVFVRTGERTLLNYLLKPLTDRLNRALTEP